MNATLKTLQIKIIKPFPPLMPMYIGQKLSQWLGVTEKDHWLWSNFQEGFTPLAVSVREEHIEMAEFLLKEGADVNLTDKDQRSQLNNARFVIHVES